MGRKKSIIATGLAMTMAFSTFTGCGPGGTQEEETYYTVSVVNDDSTKGTASVVGGNGSSASIKEDVRATLTATANDGYIFDGWYIDDELKSMNAAEFSFTPTANTVVTAKWADAATVAATSEDDAKGTATIIGAAEDEEAVTVKKDSEVTVVAEAKANYAFEGWYKNGEKIEDADASYTFSASEEVTELVAKFVTTLASVSVVSNNDSWGIAKYYGKENVEKGTTIDVMAVPKDNCEFRGWQVNGTVVSSDVQYSYTVTEDVTLTAMFGSITYCSVSVSAETGGTATVVGEATVKKGGKVAVQATAAANYAFEGWYRDGVKIEGAGATYEYTPTATETLTAKFVKTAFDVKVESNNTFWGSVVYLDGDTVAKGTSVTAAAVANDGYQFEGWYIGGELKSTSETYTFTVTEDVTVQAQFSSEAPSYTVRVSAETGGTARVDGNATVEEGGKVTVVATADAKYVFEGWYRNGEKIEGASATYEYTPTATETLVAKFTQTKFTVTVTPTTGGTATIEGEATVAKNGTVTVRAALLNDNYVFVGWYDGDNCVSTSETYVHTVTADVTLQARFAEKTYYTVSVSSNNTAWGSVSGGSTVLPGEKVTIKATAKDGYEFEGWYREDNTKIEGAGAEYEITVSENVSYVAKFVEETKETFTVTVVSEDSVKGSANVGLTGAKTSAEVTEGGKVWLRATVKAGYLFNGWYVGDVKLSTAVKYQYTPTATCTVTAKFKQDVIAGKPSGEISINTDTSATIKIMIGNDALEQNILNAAAAEFNKTYPNVAISVVPTANFEYDLVNYGADIIACIGENVAEYVNNGYLTQLDSYMDNSRFNRDAYYSSIMAMGQDPNGDQYMMPRDYSRIICCYNKTMFDTYNIAYPTNDWTWADYLAICQKFNQAGLSAGKITCAQMSYDILNWGILSSCGVTQVVNDGDWSIIDSTSSEYDALKKGMAIAKAAVDNGYVPNQQNYDSNTFRNNQAAMTFETTAAIKGLTEQSVDFDVVSFPAVVSGEGVDVGTNANAAPHSPAGAVGYGIYPKSTNKEVAWAFMQYLMGEAGQASIVKASMSVPALISLAEDTTAAWRTIKNGAGNAITAANMVANTDRDVTAGWLGKLPAEYRYEYKKYYNTFLLNVVDGKASFDAALSAFATVKK